MALRESGNKVWITLGVLLLISIPASLLLILPGFYEPHDLHHLADIYQMFRAISSGQFPPRLGPDFTYEYGYPLFNFYYLLPFYLGAAWYALIGSLTASFKFVFLLSVVLSVFGMYLFLRQFIGKFPSLVGSALFLYSPYRAVQIYVRGAIGEALALSLLPFVLWGVIRLMKRPKNYKIVAAVSVICALFIISHNYLWAIVFPFVLFLVVLLIKVESFKQLSGLLVTGLLSIGLTTYWWLPALAENKLVSSVTPFRLVDHFPFIKQLLIPSWGYGSSVWGPGDEMSFQVGAVNLAVVVFIIGMGIYRLKSHPELVSGSPLTKIPKLVRNDSVLLLALWSLVGFAISVFMMNIRSYFIWRIIPFHDFIQFPWRFLLLTTLFTSVLGGIIVHVLPAKYIKITGFLIIAACLILTIPYFRPSKVVSKSDKDYLLRFFGTSTYSEDYLLLPSWVTERPPNPPLSKIGVEGAVISDHNEINPVYYQAVVDAEKLTTVSFHSYYFPGWYAKVDGEEAKIKAGKPYGQIELEVPAGKHAIEFFWAETPLRRLADYVSLVSLAVVFYLWIDFKRLKRLNSRN